jgi:hypothetical protein
LSRPSDSTGPSAVTAARTVQASQPLPFSQPLVGRHVDHPTVGPIDGDLLISGWALCSEGPLERVLAVADGAPALHVRAYRERPDIGAAFPDLSHAAQSGFRLRIPASVVEQLAGELVVAAELPGGRQVPLWRLSITTAQASAERPPPRAQRSRRWARRRSQLTSTVDQPTSADRSTSATEAASAERLPVGSRAPRADSPAAVTALDDHFRVVALISTFNEADVIDPVLEHLASNGVWSYLIDNCSTDETVRVARRWLGRGLLGLERFENPPDGRTSWKALLTRKVELARELGADWYIHHDADEIRESPWPGASLREAIRSVDRLGYNAIDFRVLNFVPVDDTFRAGDDPREHFLRWEEPADYDRLQRKCWKAGAAELSLADGGHDVRFADRRVFPMRFLLRHYPIRSQAHGRRKVFEDRKTRFAKEELALGWHRQYDHISRLDHMFLRNPASLRAFSLDHIRLETILADGRASSPVVDSVNVPVERRDHDGRGVLDHVSPTTISGWAARDGEEEPAQVDLWDGGRVIATVTAQEPRPDLAEQGIAEGHGGFTVATPRELLDGKPHWIWATVAGSGVALGRAPLVLHVAGRLSPAATDWRAGEVERA